MHCCLSVSRIIPHVVMTNAAAKALATGSPVAVEYATCSDIGMKRTMNQDSFESRLASADDVSQHGHLFVVADGMGAHAAGELASRLAVDEISKASGPEDHLIHLREHFQKANLVIHERGQSNPQHYNMGTTCSALWLLPSGSIVGHVGDSRVYRCRGGRIEQLTFDHSLVWEMRAAGQFSGGNASTIPRNVITRCLGPHPHVEIDLEGPFSVQVGDAFLLCSDGLTGRIEDAELGVATRYLPPAEAAEFLVDLANLRGGHDNITVTIVRVLGSELKSSGTTVDEEPPHAGSTHPAWWFLAGLGMITALVSARQQYFPGIAAGGGMLLVSCAYILLQWARQQSHRTAKHTIPTAPYAIASTDLTDRVLEQLKSTFRDAAVDVHLRDEIDQIPAQIVDQDPNAVCRRIKDVAHNLRQRD